jgi:hypothetical protein
MHPTLASPSMAGGGERPRGSHSHCCRVPRQLHSQGSFHARRETHSRSHLFRRRRVCLLYCHSALPNDLIRNRARPRQLHRRPLAPKLSRNQQKMPSQRAPLVRSRQQQPMLLHRGRKQVHKDLDRGQKNSNSRLDRKLCAQAPPATHR